MLARGGVRAEVDDEAWLQAMLDAEAALARAEARAGLIPGDHAEAIARACTAAGFDLAAIGRQAADTANPVAPLVRALTASVEGAAAGDVHRGATSQDILDTAAMLVAGRALHPLLEDLSGAADAAAELARIHRDTPMAGRTLLQQALPTTFGVKAAGWTAGLDEATTRLRAVADGRLAVQLGGGAGTLASLGEDGIRVLALFAEELGLHEPVLPWHTARGRIADLAGALGEAAGAAGKPALDVVLLAQTEVAEVREGTPGRGGSSTLPHKRNPVAAVSAVACANQAPGLVATLLAGMLQEHERAAGGWQSEWLPLSRLFEATGSVAAWIRDCLEHLEVDPVRMRTNLDATNGLLLAERITTALARDLGRGPAHELVERASADTVSGDRPFADLLAATPEIASRLSPEQLGELLDPATYLGSAGAFVDRTLRDHADRAHAGRP
jgi:3-carboxy-cis,cis-muconate cycloisomerase